MTMGAAVDDCDDVAAADADADGNDAEADAANGASCESRETAAVAELSAPMSRRSGMVFPIGSNRK